jgi:hypothetical protein
MQHIHDPQDSRETTIESVSKLTKYNLRNSNWISILFESPKLQGGNIHRQVINLFNFYDILRFVGRLLYFFYHVCFVLKFESWVARLTLARPNPIADPRGRSFSGRPAPKL